MRFKKVTVLNEAINFVPFQVDKNGHITDEHGLPLKLKPTKNLRQNLDPNYKKQSISVDDTDPDNLIPEEDWDRVGGGGTAKVSNDQGSNNPANDHKPISSDPGDEDNPNNNGDKGDKGNSGDKGDKGNQSNNGQPGDKGNKGSDGDPGNQGNKGGDGDPGNQGNKGGDGDPGNQGNQGGDGDPGNKDNQGDPGDKGDQGDPGDKGNQGDKGNPPKQQIFHGTFVNPTTFLDPYGMPYKLV